MTHPPAAALGVYYQVAVPGLQEEGITLELSSKDTYQEVSQQLAAALKPALSEPLCLRFSQQNTYSQQPKPSPLRHPGQDEVHLPEMLAQFNHFSNTLYYEILDLPPPELERLKVSTSAPDAACLCCMFQDTG